SGPSPNEPAEAAEIFGYIDEILSAYDANPPTDETSKAFLDLIIPDLKALKEARNNGVIVDADYFKAHYSGDVEKLLNKYDVTPLEDLIGARDYMRSVISSTSKLKRIADYFGVSDIILGN
ncbi:MAG: hypothetical protein IJK52_09810, partial [Oscillospiraceae bacterium]|nr:hypothetical protein [Oscillospiraceae bacterium]